MVLKKPSKKISFRDLEMEKLVKEVAEEFNMPPDEVRLVIKSMFTFIRGTIESGTHGERDTFKSVRIPRIGMFKFDNLKFDKINRLGRYACSQ